MSNDGRHGNKGPHRGRRNPYSRSRAASRRRSFSGNLSRHRRSRSAHRFQRHLFSAQSRTGDALLLETPPPGGPIETIRLGLVSITARGRRLSFQKGIGSEREALAHGRSSAARSRPPSHSMASRSPLRTTLLIHRRGGVERRRSNSATSFEHHPLVVPILNFCARGAMAFNPRDNCRFGS